MSMLETAYKPFSLPGKDYYKAAGIGIPEEVNIRYLTVKEVKYFGNLVSPESFADQIMASCVREKLEMNKLLPGDRIFIFYMIRALTMDNIYSFGVNCENCGAVIEAQTDLLNLAVKAYDIDKYGYPLKMKLPFSQKEIVFTLPDRGVEKEVEAEAVKFKSEFPNGEPQEAIYVMKRIIKSVEGIDGVHMLEFFETMHYKDWRAIDKFIQETSPGPDLEGNIACEKCSYDNKVIFSVRPKEFFLL